MIDPEFFNQSSFSIPSAILASSTRYLGFWDCNPATLMPLSPSDFCASLRLDDWRCREKRGLRQQLHDEGKYFLASEIVNKLVQAQPRKQAAKDLLAETQRIGASHRDRSP